METVATIIGLAVAGFFYFLPTFIGGGKRNSGAIFAMNLLLGWSIIGWIIALVWALTKDPQPVQVVAPAQPQPTTDPSSERIRQLKQLRDEGTLTQEEFMEQISKL